jgi:hypothetical protein
LDGNDELRAKFSEFELNFVISSDLQQEMKYLTEMNLGTYFLTEMKKSKEHHHQKREKLILYMNRRKNQI